MSEVDKHASENISRILVGNKKDLEDKREVPYNEAKELADHFNVKFLETSAKESLNVEDAFTNITREIESKIAKNPTAKTNAHSGGVKLNKKTNKITKDKKGGCC
jgi:GTPase SAR1 family protein